MSAVAPALASSWSTEMELACHKLWSSFPFHSRNLQAKIIIAEIFARPWSAQCNESKCFLKKKTLLSFYNIDKFSACFFVKNTKSVLFLALTCPCYSIMIWGQEYSSLSILPKKLARNMLHLVLKGFPLGLWLLHH